MALPHTRRAAHLRASLEEVLRGGRGWDRLPSTFRQEKVMLEPFFTFLEVNFSRNGVGPAAGVHLERHRALSGLSNTDSQFHGDSQFPLTFPY